MVGVVQERELPPSEIAGCRAQWSTSTVWSKWLNCLRLSVLSPVITDELSAIGQKRELADDGQAVHRGEISPRHVGRLLQEAQTTPDPLLVDSPDERI